MKKILILLICSIAFNLNAQVTNEAQPPSWSYNLKSQPAAEVMPDFDLNAMIAEDELVATDIVNKPYRFGNKFNVSLDLFNSGEWTTLDNGDRIWRLNVVSNGARTMNFMLDRYDLPKGAEMFLYNNEHTDKIGPYTNKENQEDGILGTWIIYGDNVWIEYYEPAAVKGQGRISINEVVHGYRGFGKVEENFLKLNESGACNVDVMCNPNQGSTNGQDWTTIRNNYRNAVARIIINGAGLCTGTLINNVREDGTPYMYTANHCLGGVADGSGSAYNANGWSFGFEWYTNTPSCASASNTVGPNNPTQVVSGASLKMNHANSDTALFELNQTPPASWDLYYGGWENRFLIPSSQLGIHHPSGDIMKLSRNDQNPNAQNVNIGGTTAQVWAIADWDYGVTEGGSSGSILLNPSGHIIGELFGGAAFCNGTNDNGQPDFYGRFNVAWTGGGSAATRLRDWLDPDNTNTTTYDGDFYSTLNTSSQTAFSFEVYPNPSTDVFKFDVQDEGTFSIYDLSGKLIKQGSFNEGTTAVNMTSFANGIYFLEIMTEAGSATQKLIKE